MAISVAAAFCSSSVQSFASLLTTVFIASRYVFSSALMKLSPDAPELTAFVTWLNWLRMAPETCGPANTTTKLMIAAIRTYSMIDWPLRRTVLGATPPPRRNCHSMHMLPPFA